VTSQSSTPLIISGESQIGKEKKEIDLILINTQNLNYLNKVLFCPKYPRVIKKISLKWLKHKYIRTFLLPSFEELPALPWKKSWWHP
jgi:hypothetical protein